MSIPDLNIPDWPGDSPLWYDYCPYDYIWQEWRELGFAYPLYQSDDFISPKHADSLRNLELAERMQESENE